MAAAQQRPLLYVLVARGTTVLAEHNNTTGNVPTVAVRILERLPAEDTRVSYAQDRHMFHVLVAQGLTFMCMAEEAAGRRIPFAFLEDVRAAFLAAHGDASAQAAAYELNGTFGAVLGQRMAFFSSDPAADTIGRVRGEIMQVKDIMIENIEKVLDRGEKLDLLVDKTDLLQGEAFAFRREAKRARRVMWWKNVRLWFILGGVVAAIIFVLWLQNRGAGGSARSPGAIPGGGAAPGGEEKRSSDGKQQLSPTAARGREEKPWVAERWANEKDADSRWSHDPLERPRWGEDERDGARPAPAPRREPGRWKAGDWGGPACRLRSASPSRRVRARARGAGPGHRWEGPSALRDPAPRDRWRADEKADKWAPRTERLDLGDAGQSRIDRWRAPAARALDDRFEREGPARGGERGGGRERDEPLPGFGPPSRASGEFRASLDRLDRGAAERDGERERAGAALLPKGRGFGYGRGRAAGAPLAPGAAAGADAPHWGLAKDPELSGAGSYGRALGSLGSSAGGAALERAVSSRRRVTAYTLQHLEDLKDMMLFKLKVSELPLPRGLSVEALSNLYVRYVESDEPDDDAPAWLAEAAPRPAGAGEPAAAPAPAAAAPAGPGGAPLPPPPPLPPGMPLAALEADTWVYRDPQGAEQGPFCRSDILDWFEAAYFGADLAMRSALPGQEGVWVPLGDMVRVWAHHAAYRAALEAAARGASAGPQQAQQAQQAGGDGVVGLGDLRGAGAVDSHLPHYQAGYASATGVSAWLQQQQPGAGAAAAPVAPGPAAGDAGAAPFALPGLAGHHAAAPADAGAAAAGAWPGAHAAGFGAPPPAAIAPRQRTLFGTPLEPAAPPPPAPAPAPEPAPAPAAAAGGTTGSKMLDLLFNRGRPEAGAAPGAGEPPAAAAPANAWGRPGGGGDAGGAAPPASGGGGGAWETVPTKAAKQQERQKQHEAAAAAAAWQGAAEAPAPAPAPPAPASPSERPAPRGPVEVPLFPQAAKPEPPKAAPWAAAAPVAAAPPARSLREILEEEQARAAAAAAAAAAADEAARASAGAGTGAAPRGGAGGAWGKPPAPGAGGGALPPGWGAGGGGAPAAAAAAAAGGSLRDIQQSQAREPRLAHATSEELAATAAAKKATLGEILAARLGGRTNSNASSASCAAPAAPPGPWGAAGAARPAAVSLDRVMRQEQADREETLADLEGGSAQEEGLEDLIAALRQRHGGGGGGAPAAAAPAAAAGEDSGLFWDYGGGGGAAAAAARPAAQAPVPLPRAAVAAAAAAAAPRMAAPAAVAPPAVAGPWARAAASGAVKAPAPAPAGQPRAGAAAARAAKPAVPGAVYAAPAAPAAPEPAARRAAAAPAPLAPPPAPRGAPGGPPSPGPGEPPEGLFGGGLALSAPFAAWCRGQMQGLNGNTDMTMVELLMGLTSNSEIAEYCQMVWGNKPGVSTFVSEFVKRKVAEQSRKPGGGKKKRGGGGGGAAAAPAPAAQPAGVSAAAVGLVNAGPGAEAWSRIPKKAGKGKGRKGDE
ncbi:VAMP713 [Scenedesmus sp. PABB004]|nr:VAMP713 [Scenedesmus sp. PABB004]